MFNNSTSMVSSWTLVNWTRWKSSNCLHQSVHLGVRTDGLFQLIQLVFIITFYECALYFVSIISYVPTLGRSTNFKEKGTNWRPLKWFKTLLPIVQTHFIQLFLCIDFNKFWKKTCLFFSVLSLLIGWSEDNVPLDKDALVAAMKSLASTKRLFSGNSQNTAREEMLFRHVASSRYLWHSSCWCAEFGEWCLCPK